jgi:integrase
VPLTAAAIAALGEPGAPTDKVFAGNNLLHYLQRFGYTDRAGRSVTVHGFRSTFRDWCGDNGHDRELAEKSLAHAFGNKVEILDHSIAAYRKKLILAFCESHRLN